MFVRFDKPITPLLRHKASFVSNNDDPLTAQMRQTELRLSSIDAIARRAAIAPRPKEALF
jgi:hypothetical protein